MKDHRLIARTGVLVVFLLGMTGMLAAQNCPPAVTVSHASADQLSLSDVDFDHFRSSTLLFTIFIGNSLPVPYEATLALSLDVRFADGSGTYPGAIEYTSLPFNVPAGGRTITNLNLGPGGSDIKTDQFHFNETVKQRIKDAGLGTGLLPAGVYTFHVHVQPVTCPQPTDDQFVLVISNPSRVELRSPRDGESTTEFPLFEYYFDGDAVELIVAEQNPDQTREDAIARRPAMLDVQLTGQNSFLYAGGRPLEVGKTYVWRVVGKVNGPNGQVTDIPSDVGQFVVSSSAGGSSLDLILTQLEEIFGKRYPGIFQEIHQNGFTLQGRETLNGNPVSTQDLLNLLIQLRDQSDSAELTFE